MRYDVKEDLPHSKLPSIPLILGIDSNQTACKRIAITLQQASTSSGFHFVYCYRIPCFNRIHSIFLRANSERRGKKRRICQNKKNSQRQTNNNLKTIRKKTI